MFTINLYSNFALLQRWTQLSASQGGTAQQRIADVPRMGPVRFFFRTGGYPWCCQNGHFGVPWTKWGEGRKKTLGGVQEENAWNAEILEWIAWRVMAATFWMLFTFAPSTLSTYAAPGSLGFLAWQVLPALGEIKQQYGTGRNGSLLERDGAEQRLLRSR